MTDRTCSVDGCQRLLAARGVCPMHYMQLKREGNLPPTIARPTICSVDGCVRPVHSRGWCTMHYQRWRKRGTVEPIPPRICSIDGCNATVEGFGWCNKHYSRWKRTGRLDCPTMDSPSGMKWCPHCSNYKRTSQFYVSRTQPSGRTSWCKSCLTAAQSVSDTPRQVKRRRRARLLGRRSERYSSTEIADRDRWVCQICYRRIRPELKAPHPRSLSIDHIVPISKGGDDVKSNVQAAHLRCNILKCTGGTDQLRLIG